MKHQLERISTLFSGVSNKVYSEKEIPNSKEVILLTGNNLTHDGIISLEDAIKVFITDSEKLEKVLLKENDVILLARGPAIRAGIVSKEMAAQGVVANANFIIIRPDESQVKGEMLVAYFNSGYGHNQLMKLSKGAVIQHIPASILKTLEIPVPTNKFQKRIVEIYHASIDAQQSTMELLKQQKKTSNAMILNLIHEA